VSVHTPTEVAAQAGCGLFLLLLAGAIGAIWIGLAVIVWRVALGGL
jgi:hypothetical protein